MGHPMRYLSKEKSTIVLLVGNGGFPRFASQHLPTPPYLLKSHLKDKESLEEKIEIAWLLRDSRKRLNMCEFQ